MGHERVEPCCPLAAGRNGSVIRGGDQGGFPAGRESSLSPPPSQVMPVRSEPHEAIDGGPRGA